MNRTHGGVHALELTGLGVRTAELLDLSVNLNAYGPPPGVLEAIRNAPLDRYPDPLARLARRALADAHGVTTEGVRLGNGASELLWALVLALGAVPEGCKQAVLSTPVFGEVEAACRSLRVPVRAAPCALDREHALMSDALVAASREADTAFVYLCNPTTPLGIARDHASIAALASALMPTVLVLDESFLSLSDAWAQASRPLPPNVVRVRSLTKELTLPGVRMGYLLAEPALCRAVQAVQPAWSVSAAAQAAAEAAPREHTWLAGCRERIAADRRALVADLESLGLRPWPSSAPYVAFEVDCAATLREWLLRHHGIAVRDCASFGLPSVVRVAVARERPRRRLHTALEQAAHAGLLSPPFS